MAVYDQPPLAQPFDICHEPLGSGRLATSSPPCGSEVVTASVIFARWYHQSAGSARAAARLSMLAKAAASKIRCSGGGSAGSGSTSIPENIGFCRNMPAPCTQLNMLTLTHSMSQSRCCCADTPLANGRTCYLCRHAGYISIAHSHPATDTPRCVGFTSLSSLKAVPISTATATAHASCCLLDRHACVWLAAYPRLRGLDSISAATTSRSVFHATRILKLA